MKEQEFEPAFPTNSDNYGPRYSGPGMDLRDYFAAKALSVAWAALEAGYFESNSESSAKKMAECAYQLADQMLEARKKEDW